MLGRQRHNLIATTNEKRIVRNDQRIRAHLNQGHECRVNIVRACGLHDLDLLTDCICSFLKLPKLKIVIRIVWVH